MSADAGQEPARSADPGDGLRTWTFVGLARVAFRGTGMVASILLWYATWWVGRAFAPGASPRGARWREAIFHTWARFVLRLLRVDLRTVGTPPAEPCVLVSNHLGYLDIVVLAAVLRAVFVSKAEVRHWPLLGPATRDMGTIFVDRGAKRDLPRVNEQISAALGRGETVVLFPEGTSSRGAEVLPFRPSLLEPAVQSGSPVCYACLAYSTPPEEAPASLAVCWWGDMGFFGHVFQLLQLSRIEAVVTFGTETLRETDRKVLADRLQRHVRASFRPLR